jgi:hypothetical protein
MHLYKCTPLKTVAKKEYIYIYIYMIAPRWAGHVARKGVARDVYRVLAGKPEGERPLGRPRRRLEDNIKIDFQEVAGWGGVVGTGWSWLRIWTGGGHLWER